MMLVRVLGRNGETTHSVVVAQFTTTALSFPFPAEVYGLEFNNGDPDAPDLRGRVAELEATLESIREAGGWPEETWGE